MAKIDLKNCTIRFLDGTTVPKTLDIKVGEGTFSWSESQPREYVKDRGKLDSVRNGDEEPVDVNIDCIYEYVTADSGNSPTPEDALKQIGEANDWKSAATDACEPYSIDIHVINDVPCADIKNEKLIFADFRYEKIDHDIKAGTLKVSGKCNITMPTASRTTAIT